MTSARRGIEQEWYKPSGEKIMKKMGLLHFFFVQQPHFRNNQISFLAKLKYRLALP